jgi:hypothetical protein
VLRQPSSLRHYAALLSGPFGLLFNCGDDKYRWPDESPYAAAVQALLENGPMQGKTVDVEAVEGRPPKTIDVPDEKGGTCRYCLAEWTQEGMTAAYTFLYVV